MDFVPHLWHKEQQKSEHAFSGCAWWTVRSSAWTRSAQWNHAALLTPSPTSVCSEPAAPFAVNRSRRKQTTCITWDNWEEQLDSFVRLNLNGCVLETWPHGVAMPRLKLLRLKAITEKRLRLVNILNIRRVIQRQFKLLENTPKHNFKGISLSSKLEQSELVNWWW